MKCNARMGFNTLKSTNSSLCSFSVTIAINSGDYRVDRRVEEALLNDVFSDVRALDTVYDGHLARRRWRGGMCQCVGSICPKWYTMNPLSSF